MVDAPEPITPGTIPSRHAGRIIDGKYRLEELLGSGGVGEVWRATQWFPGEAGDVAAVAKPVALKLIVNRGREAGPKFRREIELLVVLRHPNICSVLVGGYDEPSRCYWYAMEIADRGSLASELAARGRLPIRQAMAWLRDAVEGLDAAERAGVVHCDIKPGNLLLETSTLEGRPTVRLLVADFGVGRMLGATASAWRENGGFTAAYASPEQQSAGDVTSASDQYSLGVTFYHLMTGELPAADAVAPFDPGTKRRGLPPRLREVLMQMTEPEPRARFEHFEDVRLALRDVELPRRSWRLVAAAFCIIATTAYFAGPMLAAGHQAPPAEQAPPLASSPSPSQPEPGPERTSARDWERLPSGIIAFRGREWRVDVGPGTYHAATIAVERANLGTPRDAPQWRLPAATDRDDVRELVRQGAIPRNGLPFWCGAARSFRARTITIDREDRAVDGEQDKSQSAITLLVRVAD